MYSIDMIVLDKTKGRAGDRFRRREGVSSAIFHAAEALATGYVSDAILLVALVSLFRLSRS